MALTYRKDIDGLRAIAVLSVIFYHADIGFPGGFAGVDVFFVISGYLITTLIVAETDSGRFSIAHFYERRARRILPALFTVIAAASIGAWYLLLPVDLIFFGKSAAAAALFYSNFLFRNEAGYFDTMASLKPLLHTWSLAVEEQFYIVFPLLLTVLAPRRQLRLAIVILLVLLSFLLGLFWMDHRPVDAFYLLPARFWELGIGGVLALLPQLAPRRKSTGSALVVLGLWAIGIAVFGFAKTTPFPGYAALLPCLGAVFILLGGKVANPASAFLALPPIAFVGRISYSLYLWHWPLIVFVQYRIGRTLRPGEACIVLAVAMMIATLSWLLIEQPLRRRRLVAGRGAFFAGVLPVMALLAAIGFFFDRAHGLPGRLPPAAARIYAAKQDAPVLTSACFTDRTLSGPTDADVRAGRLCDVGAGQSVQADFLVWGDSHAAAMEPAIAKAATALGRRGLLAGEGGCPPLLDYHDAHPSMLRQAACIARNQAVMDLIARRHFAQVFLIARWPRETLGAQYGREGPYFDPAAPYKTWDRSVLVRDALERTLAELSARHVKAVLVMDVPEVGYDVPYNLAKAAIQGRPADIDPPRAVVEARQHLARAILQAAAEKYHADFIDPTSSFCDATSCRTAIDGRPLYADADHITRTTAESLSGLFIQSLAVQMTRANPG